MSNYSREERLARIARNLSPQTAAAKVESVMPIATMNSDFGVSSATMQSPSPSSTSPPSSTSTPLKQQPPPPPQPKPKPFSSNPEGVKLCLVQNQHMVKTLQDELASMTLDRDAFQAKYIKLLETYSALLISSSSSVSSSLSSSSSTPSPASSVSSSASSSASSAFSSHEKAEKARSKLVKSAWIDKHRDQVANGNQRSVECFHGRKCRHLIYSSDMSTVDASMCPFKHG